MKWNQISCCISKSEKGNHQIETSMFYQVMWVTSSKCWKHRNYTLKLTCILTGTYSEPCHASKKERFVKNSQRLLVLTIFVKHFILGVWWDSEYASRLNNVIKFSYVEAVLILTTKALPGNLIKIDILETLLDTQNLLF